MGRLESVSEISWIAVKFPAIVFLVFFFLTCAWYLSAIPPSEQTKTTSRIIDLDVDIGADAVDYKYEFANTSYGL